MSEDRFWLRGNIPWQVQTWHRAGRLSLLQAGLQGLLPSDPKTQVFSSPGHENWGGNSCSWPWARGSHLENLHAAVPTGFLMLCTSTKIWHFPPASTTHSLYSLLVPFHNRHPIAISVLTIKQPVSCAPLGFVSTVAKERATLHIHSKHSIHNHKHPIPIPFDKVYKRHWLYPTPLLTKTVRYWGVHKHRTGWRLFESRIFIENWKWVSLLHHHTVSNWESFFLDSFRFFGFWFVMPPHT